MFCPESKKCNYCIPECKELTKYLTNETILLWLSMGDNPDLLTALLQAQISLQAMIKKQQDIWYHNLG